MPTDAEDLHAIALLDEPVRRALYDWVVMAGRPVSRDDAAAGVGIGRALAAFHLDRLVGGGLLRAEFQRRSGRTGPGAGRPAKHYVRAEDDVAISVPERRYDVAASVMAAALEMTASDGPPDELVASARSSGLAAGRTARQGAGRRPSRARLRSALDDALRASGYAPRRASRHRIELANCPFHALVADHRPVVCGMNLALTEGLLAGLGDTGLEPRLEPAPDRCCVALEERPRRHVRTPEGVPSSRSQV